MAAAEILVLILACIAAIVLGVLVQKHLVRGLTLGAVRG